MASSDEIPLKEATAAVKERAKALAEEYRKAEKALKEPSPFVFLDLKKFCRPGVTTTVTVILPGKTEPWLQLGVVELTPLKHAWAFGARLSRGATDDEEDSAWAVHFDLIGVTLDMVLGHTTFLTGWLRGDGSDGFCVPTAEWDPFKDAEVCERDGCEPKGHPITEYLPQENKKLFSVLRGRRVEIVISADREEDEES